MNVLIIGSGGREHALAWAISASPILTKLYCAPGNAGIADCAECVPLDAADHGAVVAFCRAQAIELVVVGPEAPLVAGLADDLREAGIRTFGPGRAGAQLEGSKSFTKELCVTAGIPTAGFGHFDSREAALGYLRDRTMPIVIKADGLAAGKGVTIAETLAEAERAVEDCFAGAFGEAGASVVIEDFMDGEEASFFALCDGRNVLPLASAQDHKRAFDGDTGPNTGGMGAYSPAPVMTPEMTVRVMDEIILPTVAALNARGIAYQGVLFAGLMIGADGPKLIEYNARFGDPECQVLMLRLKSDMLAALLATADGVLGNFDLRWSDETALAVVMAANGYPGAYEKGSEIEGLDAAAEIKGVTIFHAGTKRDGARVLSNGGRVLNVCALGATAAEARTRAYEAVDRIDWPGGFCRRDIGWRAVQRETPDAKQPA
ncbi:MULTISPECIES: phosphoribosylamine--glycine ligase [Rhodomicrobium]|uniref:phosphoribosylamine--glycine ligase n=1 Tax=Rhodomicrobium TaxID=1068 RepID=UPI000B4B9412|nr:MULTISPECIES: phosphoribosylamine--glycine ligase [Rhodomicrobium]